MKADVKAELQPWIERMDVDNTLVIVAVKFQRNLRPKTEFKQLIVNMQLTYGSFGFLVEDVARKSNTILLKVSDRELMLKWYYNSSNHIRLGFYYTLDAFLDKWFNKESSFKIQNENYRKFGILLAKERKTLGCITVFNDALKDGGRSIKLRGVTQRFREVVEALADKTTTSSKYSTRYHFYDKSEMTNGR